MIGYMSKRNVFFCTSTHFSDGAYSSKYSDVKLIFTKPHRYYLDKRTDKVLLPTEFT